MKYEYFRKVIILIFLCNINFLVEFFYLIVVLDSEMYYRFCLKYSFLDIVVIR